MKQVTLNLGSGDVSVTEVPSPGARANHVLIETRVSLVSIGTERMLVRFGQASLLGKAKSQPERVRAVLDKIRTDGLAPTLRAVRSKLDQPLALGYCNAGIVIEVGDGVAGFKPGDRVVSNGPHAQRVCVPATLCARIPDTVSFDEAAFAILGAIGLQGVRLASPGIGECFGVIGVGLIGLIAAQILRANGCRVIAFDLDAARCELARKMGFEAVQLSRTQGPHSAAREFSAGIGLDGVIVATDTSSDSPVRQAAQICRKRGRIVLVGSSGLRLNRADFYEKELTFQVSCSYGPGRYDRDYETKGKDYPVGYVRWTARRNFEAVLGLMEQKRLELLPLITRRVPIEQAEAAYAPKPGTDDLAVLLTHRSEPEAPAEARSAKITIGTARPARGAPTLAVIGSGNFVGSTLLRNLSGQDARLKTIASQAGLSGTHLGRKFGFEESTTDVNGILSDPAIDAVVIATRHDQHARLACAALKAGKHVYVEKPIALTHQELAEITACLEREASPILAGGFNRRFAPHARKLKELLARASAPASIAITVNAGPLPADHWVNDPIEGGGRLLAEGCHFVDLLRFLAGSPIRSFDARSLPEGAGSIVMMSFANGSIGSLHYLSNGSQAFPKERVEVFCGGGILRLDNFRSLTGFGWPGFKRLGGWSQDKGHSAALAAFLSAVRAPASGPPVAYEELLEVSRVSIDLASASKSPQ